MVPLYSCKSCGFLSTRGDAFRSVQRVRFCHSCADGYEDGREPVAGWVRDAIASPSLETTHER